MITFKSSSPWTNQRLFNTTQSGDITGWANGTNLPAARSSFGVAVTKSKVYLIGGFLGTSTPVSSILSASIDGSGVVGSFSTYANSLPIGLANPGIAITENRIFVLGGQTLSDGTTTSLIHSASIDANGNIGTFSEGDDIPLVGSFLTTFVHNNSLYIVFEYSIYSAPINSDGTLGYWTGRGSLPSSRVGHLCWRTGSRLYVWGDYSKTSYCQYATIDGNGGVSEFVDGTSVGASYSFSNIIQTANYVYLLGGRGVSTSTQNVYYAPITNGVVGSWSSGTGMGVLRDSFGLFATSSRLYVAGGKQSGTDQNGVRYATFSGGLNDYTNEFYESISTAVISSPLETIAMTGAIGKYATISLQSQKETIVASGSAYDTRISYVVAEFEKWEMEANTGASLDSDFSLLECSMTGAVTIHGDISGDFELFQCDSNSGAVLIDSFESWTADMSAKVDIKATLEAQFELFDMTGELSWSINAQLDASFKLFTCDGEASKKDTNDISADFELFTCSGEISKTKNCTIEASFLPFSSTGYISSSIVSELDAYFEEFTCFGEINKTSVFESIKFSR